MTKVAEIRAKPISDGAQMRLANRDMPGADRPLNSSLGLQMYNSKGLLGRLVDNNEDLKLVRKDTVLAGDLRWPVNALGQGQIGAVQARRPRPERCGGGSRDSWDHP